MLLKHRRKIIVPLRKINLCLNFQNHLIKFLQTFAQQQCYPTYFQALNAQERHTLSKIGVPTWVENCRILLFFDGIESAQKREPNQVWLAVSLPCGVATSKSCPFKGEASTCSWNMTSILRSPVPLRATGNSGQSEHRRKNDLNIKKLPYGIFSK